MAEDLDKYNLSSELQIDDSKNLDSIREKAITKIQEYSGRNWSDHNIHDPGIAIIEQLSFAFADLSYQFSAFQNTNELTLSDGYLKAQTNKDLESFITFKDLTEILLTHPGIYKVYYIPSISNPVVRGVYDIIVYTSNYSNDKEVKDFIQNILEIWRPLCTAIQGVHIPPVREITVNLDVEINTEDNIQKVVENYFYEIRKFLEGGKTNQDLTHVRIFNLENFSEKVTFELQAADLVAQINQVPYSENIRHISISDPEYPFVWTLKYTRPYRLEVSPKSSLRLFHQGVLIGTFSAEDTLKSILGNSTKNKIKYSNKGKQNLQSLFEYSSIQRGFPESFGLEKEFWGELDVEDISALQLKGVLTAFDLVISKFTSDLEQLYFLINSKNPDHTQISQNILKAIPSIEYVWLDFCTKFSSNVVESDSTNNRYTYWKEYLNDIKNNLHELVYTNHRVEEEAMERRIGLYTFLLKLFGFSLDHIESGLYGKTLDLQEIYCQRLLNYWVKNRNRRVHAQNPFGSALTRDSLNGFAGLISALLQLDFNTEEFVTQIDKIYNEITDENGLNAELLKGFDELTYWGQSPDFYKKDNSGKWELQNEKGEIVLAIDNFSDDSNVERIIEKIQRIHEWGEGFLLLEHFEYCPRIEESVHGVHIKSNDQIIIDVKPKFKVLDLYQLLNRLEEAFKFENFEFTVVQVAESQFKNSIRVGQEYFSLQRFYESEKSALQDQEQLIQYLKPHLLEYEFYDQQYAKYEFTVDPYSYTYSIILPSWHKKINRKQWEKRIFHLLDSFTPPHLIINTQWLDPIEYYQLIKSLKNYQTETDENKLDEHRTQIFTILNAYEG